MKKEIWFNDFSHLDRALTNEIEKEYPTNARSVTLFEQLNCIFNEKRTQLLKMASMHIEIKRPTNAIEVGVSSNGHQNFHIKDDVASDN